MTRLGPLLLALLLAGCSGSQSVTPPGPGPGPLPASSWTMFRGDLARDGHPAGATLTAAAAARLALAWRVDLGSPIEGGPVVAGGLVVAGTAGGTLTAVSAARGERVWTVPGLGPLGQPLISDDKVIVGSGDGHLYAIELRTGERLWDWRAPGDRPAILDAPIVYRGLLLVGIGTQPGAPPEVGRLVALDPASGDRFWASCLRPDCTPGAGITSSVSVDSAGIGYVGVGNPDAAVAAFDVGTGRLGWQRRLSASRSPGLEVTATPLLFSSQGRLLVGAGSADGRFAVLAAASGAPVWSRLLSNPGPASSVSGSAAFDGRLLFVPSAGTPAGLQAVRPGDGAAIWRHDTPLPVLSSPAVGRDVVVFGDGAADPATAGALVAVASGDGHLVWSFDTGAGVVASPAIVGEAVYAADLGGHLLAFRPAA